MIKPPAVLWMGEAVGRKDIHALVWADNEYEATRLLMLDDPMWQGALVKPVLSIDGYAPVRRGLAGMGTVRAGEQ